MTRAMHPLVEPDVMVPEQFFATAPTKALSKTGEYRLLVAVLQDAIHCFQTNMHGTSRREQRLFAETKRWIMGSDPNDHRPPGGQSPTLSFEYVCEILDIVPDHLRASLRRDAGRVQRRGTRPFMSARQDRHHSHPDR